MLANNNGVVSSYFIAESVGWKPNTSVLGLPARATMRGPVAASAIAMSSVDARKISALSNSRSLVWSPAAKVRSERQRSSLALAPLLITGIGDLAAGGAIQIVSTAGRSGGAKRSRTTIRPFDLALYWAVGI